MPRLLHVGGLRTTGEKRQCDHGTWQLQLLKNMQKSWLGRRHPRQRHRYRACGRGRLPTGKAVPPRAEKRRFIPSPPSAPIAPTSPRSPPEVLLNASGWCAYQRHREREHPTGHAHTQSLLRSSPPVRLRGRVPPGPVCFASFTARTQVAVSPVGCDPLHHEATGRPLPGILSEAQARVSGPWKTPGQAAIAPLSTVGKRAQPALYPGSSARLRATPPGEVTGRLAQAQRSPQPSLPIALVFTAVAVGRDGLTNPYLPFTINSGCF